MHLIVCYDTIMRLLFPVSTKAAIYSEDASHVLVIYADKNKSWGLPGGHIEAGETPDQAIERELMEECGLAIPHLQRRDFFLHSKGKIILAYTGVTPSRTLQSTQHNCEGTPTWVTRAEFATLIIEPHYKELVLAAWPSTNT